MMCLAIRLCLLYLAQSAACPALSGVGADEDELHAYEVSLLQHSLQVDVGVVGQGLQRKGERNQANVESEHSKLSVPVHRSRARRAEKKSKPAWLYPFSSTSKEPSAGAQRRGRGAVLYYVNGAVFVAMVLFIVRMALMQDVSDVAENRLPSAEDRSIGQVLIYVIIWSSLGILLIFFNKLVFLDPAEGGFGFPCPIALTWWHMFTGMVFTKIVYYTYPQAMPAAYANRIDSKSFWRWVVPFGFAYSFYLALINLAYLQLSVSCVGMLNASGPLFVYGFSVAAGLESLTIAALVAIAVVVIGVTSASFGEMAFSWIGVVIQYAALCLDAVRVTLMKSLVSSKGFQLDPISSLYYFSPVCMLCLLGPVVLFEGDEVLAALTHSTAKLFGALVLNATVAILLNLSLFFLVSHVSPTSVSVASIIRDVGLTFGSAYVFNTRITLLQVLGYATACFGVRLWNRLKARPGAINAAFERLMKSPARGADAKATEDSVPEASADIARLEKVGEKAAAGEGAVQNAAAKKPAAEEAAAEEAASAKAAAEVAASEKAAIEKIASEEAAAEKATLEKVALEKAFVENTKAEKAAFIEKIALEKAAIQKGAEDKAAAEEAASEKTTAEKIASGKVVAEKATLEKVALEKGSAAKEILDKAAFEKIAVEKPATETVEEAAVEKASIEKIASEKAATNADSESDWPFQHMSAAGQN